jgi:hypothetical protein
MFFLSPNNAGLTLYTKQFIIVAITSDNKSIPAIFLSSSIKIKK